MGGLAAGLGPGLHAVHRCQGALRGIQNVSHADVRDGLREQIAAPGAPDALQKAGLHHQRDDLLQILDGKPLTLGNLLDGDRRDAVAVLGDINECGQGITAFGGNHHSGLFPGRSNRRHFPKKTDLVKRYLSYILA